MATSWTHEDKHDATITHEGEYKPPAKFGFGKFDRSRFDKEKAGEGQEWTHEDKHDATIAHETKN